MQSATRSPLRLLFIGALFLIMSSLALLPWWRNHDRLRDFYDYGLFINANARLAEGLRPFADFTTPAQTATFLLNYASERIGGGTYIGMTRGAALLTVAGLFALGLALARRWTPLPAILVAGAVVITSASQHTIIFYNPLGVLAMALVVWSFAAAPLLCRQDLGWHALAAFGLFLGGLNKINFHLIACAMAVGWILLGSIERKSGLRPVLVSLLFVALFGLILPVATEITWTGASAKLWFYNIVQLPMQARGGRVTLLGTTRLYLSNLHDYYGQMRLPQTGLIGLLLPLVAAVAAWRTPPPAPSSWRRAFIVLAAVFAALASIALLLTNNEIAHLTISAILVLTVSLWLGFNVPAKGGWFIAGVLSPALLLGAFAWESAWQGQRSQFGHSRELLANYLPGEKISPDFGYVKGTYIPPSIVNTLADIARWRAELPEEERAQIFYGPGCEWLEHVWPVRKVPGLAMVPSAFDGPKETALFEQAVLTGTNYRYLLVPEAWDNWLPGIQQAFNQRFLKEKVGTAFYLYRKLPDGVLWARPLDYNPGIGGNVDTTLLISTMPLAKLSDGRQFLGITRAMGELELAAPSRRVSGEAVLKRMSAGPKLETPVHFEVYAITGNARFSRWKADVLLPEGKDELVVPTDQIDASDLPLLYTVTIPEPLAGQVVAGWRAPRLWDVIDRTKEPPLLQNGVWRGGPAGKELGETVLPATLRGSPVYTRNATLKDGLCRLLPGGELWIHLQGLHTDIAITAQVATAATTSYEQQLRVVFYKSGRLESFNSTVDSQTGTLRFNVWSPEGDGWLGVLADPSPTTPPYMVRLESAR